MTRALQRQLKDLPVEEVANTITHGLGLLLSILGFAVLVVLASLRGDAMLITGCIIYGTSLVVLYGASTVYHSATRPERKELLRLLDHCCIYLLIAGSYTPFGLVIGGDLFGRALLIGIWAFAVVGIILKLIFRDRFTVLTVTSYVVMGWLGALSIQPLFNAMGIMPVALAVAGGVAYTLGVVFFPWKSIRHHHAIFHVFVLAGSIFHYFAVVLYVVPYSAAL
jgi:hemolysin III